MRSRIILKTTESKKVRSGRRDRSRDTGSRATGALQREGATLPAKSPLDGYWTYRLGDTPTMLLGVPRARRYAFRRGTTCLRQAPRRKPDFKHGFAESE